MNPQSHHNVYHWHPTSNISQDLLDYIHFGVIHHKILLLVPNHATPNPVQERYHFHHTSSLLQQQRLYQIQMHQSPPLLHPLVVVDFYESIVVVDGFLPSTSTSTSTTMTMTTLLIPIDDYSRHYHCGDCLYLCSCSMLGMLFLPLTMTTTTTMTLKIPEITRLLSGMHLAMHDVTNVGWEVLQRQLQQYPSSLSYFPHQYQ
mmetsp:Transcript_7730/g.8297  ORF Transcript_7730/g.8297 Transcript_7730/m.8297 type:complete len:202 (+) Transcript_7730:862-1467(+)